MTFSSRAEAGRRLGELLIDRDIQPDIVVGLPRGGVVVAAEVARMLNKPLDVLVVRKIGHPEHREYALGALAEYGIVLLDGDAMALHWVDQRGLHKVIAEETARVEAHKALFHPAGSADFNGSSVLIVDDGIATGSTTEAAVMSARKQNAREVIVAVPVASTSALNRLQKSADRVFALMVETDFVAVGCYYDDFPQTTDDEVLALLSAAQ
jgi:putative phosphoribosyl transferase